MTFYVDMMDFLNYTILYVGLVPCTELRLGYQARHGSQASVVDSSTVFLHLT